MSNATQDSRDSGDNRRRRSRGGQNRRNNNNNQQDRRGGDRDQRGNDRREPGGPPRAEEFRPQGGNRPARKYSPPKLTLWQKILKAIGLYKEPVRPPRPERKPDAVRNQGAAAGGESRVKSNTRNVRTDGAPQEKRREREPREGGGGERGERAPRSRDNNRARGGDSSTVESARVYVGNLSYEVSESDLQDLFKGIGGVRNVEIVYNRSTHRSKGYGFVEMLHVDEAKRSVEVLHDQPFMGRKLTVSGAKSKGQDDREDKEDRPERAPRPAAVAAVVATPVVVTEEAVAPVETVTNLQETSPEIAVEAAVHNVEAVGAPDVIVEAVEHQVAEATDAHPTEEKHA
jgi:hypothetical protein